MGLESKERVLWTWSMEEVGSQCSFCELIVGGAGKQESRDLGYVWSSRDWQMRESEILLCMGWGSWLGDLAFEVG